MKRNVLPLLGIAFVVALAASGIFYGVFVSQLKRASQVDKPSQLAVAARSLDRGTVLKPSDLKLSPWAGAAPPGSFAKLEQAAGKTVYVSIQENEPITESRLAPEKANGGIGIAKGMRAVSLRVIDSSGLIPFLRAGHHVDVQAVQNRNNPDAVLSTILQNVEVLSVQALPEGNYSQMSPSVVTIMTSPENADRVALADSGSSIRLLLRNPLDNDEVTRPGVLLASIFQPSGKGIPRLMRASWGRPQIQVPLPENSPGNDGVDLEVRVAGASAQAMEDFESTLSAEEPRGAIRVTALPEGAPGDRIWTSLQQHIELLSSSRVRAFNLRAASLRTGKQWKSAQGGLCGLSIRFESRLGPNRILHLRIQPEVTVPSGSKGIRTRRIIADLDLADGQSAIVTGLGEPGESPNLVDSLFASDARPTSHSDLILIVTPRLTEARQATASLFRR